MSWFGRQLRTYSKNGISANFTYDVDGLRSAKSVDRTGDGSVSYDKMS